MEKGLVFVGGDGGELSWSLATVAVGGEIRARLRMQASCIWVLS